MYRFRYYYKNGKNSYQNIDEFDSEIKQITHNNHFNTSLDKKELHTFLELAMKEYEKNFNDIYRIDIIDDTDKILDYIDKSECLVDGKKGHLLYDENSGEVIDVKADKIYDSGLYRFKYYYKDGTTEISGCYGTKPELMYNDFDGLLDWDEFDSLSEKNMTTKKVLELAVKAYKGFLPDFYRIEIINDKTNKVIDYIDISEKQ